MNFDGRVESIDVFSGATTSGGGGGGVRRDITLHVVSASPQQSVFPLCVVLANSPPDTDDLRGADAPGQFFLSTLTPSWSSRVGSSTLSSFRGGVAWAGAGAGAGPMRQTATTPSRLHVAKAACGSRKQMLFTCVAVVVVVKNNSSFLLLASPSSRAATTHAR